MNEIASTPVWFRPLILKVISPQPGIDRLAFLAITSLTKLIVSPA